MKQSTKLLEEPSRCIHIGDRDDIYELLRGPGEAALSSWYAPAWTTWLGMAGTTNCRPLMRRIEGEGHREVQVRDAKGAVSEATVKIDAHHLRVYPPVGKQKEYPPLMLTVIYAQKASAPRGRVEDRLEADH